MPSLVITKDAGQPLYGDWAKGPKRQEGQNHAGKTLLASFSNQADFGAMVTATLSACITGGYSTWLRYDGDDADSFAHVVAVTSKGEEEEVDREGSFLINGRKAKKYKVEVAYKELKNTGDQTPIQYAPDGDGILEIVVREDSAPGQKKKKRMNVVIPSDYADFDDTYLKQMAQDIEDIPAAKDPDYLLSSLTFRRCL